MRLKTPAGLTLIELLLALSLGLGLMTALTGLFVDTLATNSRSLQSSQLETEMQAVLALMSNDLRRAGYVSYWPAGSQIAAAEQKEPAVTIAQHQAEAAGSCVLFRIDANHNGIIDSAGEAFGYRLRNGSVQRRQLGADCSTNGWQTLTDANTHRVQHLSFTLATDRPLLTIHLTMQSRRYADMTRHRQQQLRLANVLPDALLNGIPNVLFK